MIHHDIRYRRFTRRNAIQRKRKIAVSSFCFSHEYLADPRHVGQWAKGKVHCSCPLCACKSTKVIGKGQILRLVILYPTCDNLTHLFID